VLPASLKVPVLKKRIGKELSKDDDLLGELLEGALAQAQAPAPLGTGRLLLPDPAPDLNSEGNDTAEPVARTFLIRGRHIALPDAREITSVVVDEQTDTPTVLEGDLGYSTLSRNGLMVRLTLHREHRYLWDQSGAWWNSAPEGINRPLQHHITVTGKFGFAELPVDLRSAIYALAARNFYEREAGYADQVQIAEGAAVQAYFRQLPPTVKLAFANYTLPTGLFGLA
jgi:hypothetical protein